MSRHSGRHHHSSLQRERDEARLRLARVERAHRRAEQVGATTPVDGTPAQRSGAAKLVIDNAVARRDPLTRPFPAVPGLPGARRSPSAPLPAHRRRPEAVIGAR
ncbi:hypothetical protein [Actinomycetospora sp. NBRC 106378]|jgi:hypothetical protein|uniref:hypothetical protein n=1 Tax=Actinomycetospora sp. NBRC 106378 TaxID=3032208 RepID=UPI0024A28027|nr:hypothetical protein [Actinomycetospora sp. NBRC 106378]GLZ50536.1 hypothetical protein Acsp07_01530 [Actinomycetospora sp. NBRC 106378]